MNQTLWDILSPLKQGNSISKQRDEWWNSLSPENKDKYGKSLSTMWEAWLESLSSKVRREYWKVILEGIRAWWSSLSDERKSRYDRNKDYDLLEVMLFERAFGIKNP